VHGNCCIALMIEQHEFVVIGCVALVSSYLSLVLPITIMPASCSLMSESAKEVVHKV